MGTAGAAAAALGEHQEQVGSTDIVVGVARLILWWTLGMADAAHLAGRWSQSTGSQGRHATQSAQRRKGRRRCVVVTVDL